MCGEPAMCKAIEAVSIPLSKTEPDHAVQRLQP
jgi:hypothetical protein